MMNDAILIPLLGKWAMQEQTARDMIDWAIAEIVAERDTPAICVLAGMSYSDTRLDVEDLFLAALEETGVPMPSRDQCLWNYARFTAKQIITGQITPFDGCGFMDKLYYEFALDCELKQADTFWRDKLFVWVSLWSSLDQIEAFGGEETELAQLASHIRAEAKNLLETDNDIEQA